MVSPQLFSQPKTYLITGGAGFIGSHVSETLIEQGLELSTNDSRFDLTCLRGELLHDMALTEESLESYRSALSMAANEVDHCRAWIGTAAGLLLRDDCSGW